MNQEVILTEEILAQLENSSSSATPNLSDDALKTFYALGYAKYQHGKYEEAKLFFRYLTLVDSFDIRYWMGLAGCHQKLKNYHQAIECYSIVALQNYENPYVHFHAAECYFADNLPEKGLLALDSAIKTAQKCPSHQSLLAQLKLMQASWKDKNTREISKGTI